MAKSTPSLDSDNPVTLQHTPSGGTVTISAFGATVINWRSKTGKEILFLSPKADLSGAKAIRGGIPICFPQFAGGPLPAHGFARTSRWQLISANTEGDAPYATFRLADTETSRAIWPHRFVFDYSVELTENLRTSIEIKNTGDQPFSFQLALHTYFKVSDIAAAVIDGLGSLTYIDKLLESKRYEQTSQQFKFDGETDRVYLRAPDQLSISDANGGKITVQKSNFPDAVVWNPWEQKSAGMKDLEPTGFRQFACLEVGAIEAPITLLPNTAWRAQQVITSTL